MAKIARRHLINTVKQSYLKCNLLLVLSLAAVVLCAFFAFFSYGITLVFVPLFIFIMLKLKKQRGILRSGAEGEKRVLELLSRLPKDFYVIPDVELVVGQKTAQIDYIIVGPTGIFVVEVKNLKGVISGSADDEMLLKTKMLKDGSSDTKQIYNPLLQVSTHARLLSELLFKHKYYSEIAACVYFSHPASEVKLTGLNAENNVFYGGLGGDKLLHYILGYTGHGLSKPKIKKLKKIIFFSCR
ncbi:MAG: NERD domain-containing protein [Oscillospiraceae bacterium]|nr:NERD domain-containing protein [Oscillospiraceae bacterium]